MSEKESTKAAASTAGTSGNGKKRTAPPGYKLIEEGSAAMLFGEQNEVFYNKVQVCDGVHQGHIRATSLKLGRHIHARGW